MIIGIAGTIGAGKGTVVEYLKTKGFSHYSSSDVLKRILSERGLELTRLNMSELANELMRDYEGGVLHFSQKYSQGNNDEASVFEALHRVSEGLYIKSIGGMILGIDAAVRVRFDRAIKRQEGAKDNVTFEQFLADSEREDEGKTGSGPNIKAVIKMADSVISNNGTKEELETAVDAWLNSLPQT